MKKIIICILVILLLWVYTALAAQAVIVVKVNNGVPNTMELNERLATGWSVISASTVMVGNEVKSIVYVVQRADYTRTK